MHTRLATFAVLVGALSFALWARPSAPAPDTFCGHAYAHVPAIEPESIGPLRLGVPMLVLKRSCPGARDTTFGRYDAFYVTAFGSRIDVLGDRSGQPVGDQVALAIRVSGGARLRTTDGIGPGVKLRDAERVWGRPLVGGCPAGYSHAYNFPHRQNLSLDFAADCHGSRTGGDVSTYPDSLTIQAVEIFVPLE